MHSEYDIRFTDIIFAIKERYEWLDSIDQQELANDARMFIYTRAAVAFAHLDSAIPEHKRKLEEIKAIYDDCYKILIKENVGLKQKNQTLDALQNSVIAYKIIWGKNADSIGVKSLNKISVIVPVYNVEKYLPECLDSIINQTHKDIEIICINDGSPDNSLEILKRYAEKDSRIKIIDKENEGVGKARNDGIRAATGEFIAFMDSDDYYPSDNVLDVLYNSAKENCVKFAGGRKIRLMPDGHFEKDSFFVTEYGKKFTAHGLTEYSDFQYDYGYTQYIYECKMLAENGIEFPPYKRFQDPPFFIRAMNTAGRFYAADIDSYCYRQLPGDFKYSAEKTLDYILGLIDNLKYSRDNELAKLHYLTAMRLDKECSFMAIKNIFGDKKDSLVSEIMRAALFVDTEWLKENGYDIREPFVPEVFDYLISTAEKYEKIRNNGFSKAISKIIKR